MEKNKVTYETVDQYIADFAPEVQELLQSLRKVISEAAPEAVEKISYQMPTWFLHKNLVHFAAYKTHIGFYPAPSGIEVFKEELARYKGAKGSVQFPIKEPLPYELITRIVKYRVEENQQQAAEKRKKK
ncbi:iron chaperone [Paenibacillus sp. FSL H3-0333]|uniref:iron chaperone n=1 Tax=Paenibacillus sp. FSL H3-0333 TaxID=2921373 RepID=UPI0030F90832